LIETLKQLIRLQAIDSSIAAATERKNEGPQRIQELEERLQQLDQEMQQMKAQVEDLTQKRRETELELEEIRGKIGKSQARLSLVKNNREYRAIIKEAEELKRLMKSKEEAILRSMEEQEGLERSVKEREETWKREKESAEESKKEIARLVHEADAELAAYADVKAEITRDIDPETLDKYDFIRENRAGIAIAGVSKGICMACRMNLPPQRFNELMKTDRLLTCPSCQRFIYWMDHEDLKEATEEDMEVHAAK
jgi:predicted  nucleic acid-binding Zn-ribbon protein